MKKLIKKAEPRTIVAYYVPCKCPEQKCILEKGPTSYNAFNNVQTNQSHYDQKYKKK